MCTAVQSSVTNRTDFGPDPASAIRSPCVCAATAAIGTSLPGRADARMPGVGVPNEWLREPPRAVLQPPGMPASAWLGGNSARYAASASYRTRPLQRPLGGRHPTPCPSPSTSAVHIGPRNHYPRRAPFVFGHCSSTSCSLSVTFILGCSLPADRRTAAVCHLTHRGDTPPDTPPATVGVAAHTWAQRLLFTHMCAPA